MVGYARSSRRAWNTWTSRKEGVASKFTAPVQMFALQMARAEITLELCFDNTREIKAVPGCQAWMVILECRGTEGRGDQKGSKEHPESVDPWGMM